MKRFSNATGTRAVHRRAWLLSTVLMLTMSPVLTAAENDVLVLPRAYALAQAEPAGDTQVDELKALTEQVVKTLNTVAKSGKEKAAPSASAPQDYASLMKALSALVQKATVQGKSSKEILALIEEALAEQDTATLDALLAQAGGKVGLRRLLGALVRKAAMQAVAKDPYVQMLQAEGESTRVAESAPAKEAGTGRTVVVQPGDTLSILALKYYGAVSKWRDIFNANKSVLKDPNLVPAGIRLKLP